MKANLSHYFLVLLDKGNNRLTVILRDVLRLVLKFLLVDLFPLLRLFLLRTGLILRHSFKLRDHPRLFIEVITVRKLRHYGSLINLHNGPLLLFFFGEAVHNTIIVMKMILLRKDVVEFNLA